MKLKTLPKFGWRHSNDTQSSSWYVFYDDNQNVFHRGTKFLGKFPVHFRLTRNLRNALEVFSRFEKYYHDDSHGVFECRNDCEGMVSFHPEIKHATDLIRFVSDLVRCDAIDPSDIVLLTCGHLAESRFRLEDVARKLHATQPSFAGLKATSVRKFKGLERPVVILTDLDAAATEPGGFIYGD
jgi:hypothetical protein